MPPFVPREFLASVPGTLALIWPGIVLVLVGLAGLRLLHRRHVRKQTAAARLRLVVRLEGGRHV